MPVSIRLTCLLAIGLWLYGGQGFSQSVPNFNASQTTVCAGTCINFTDLSSGFPTAWLWTFNGGAPNSSTAQNPANICYNTTGAYDVTLEIQTAIDTVDTTFTAYITVNSCPPVANFAASSTLLCKDSCISFTDLSTGSPTAWSWTFPGGNPGGSTLQNPGPICYPVPGMYSVTLQATNASGMHDTTFINYITVEDCSPPVASFTVNDSLLCINQCVQFISTSSNAVTHSWSFPGGTPTGSNSATPLVCYDSVGVFPVQLLVTNPYGSDTLFLSTFIDVNEYPWVVAGPDITIRIGENGAITCVGNCDFYQWKALPDGPWAQGQSIFVSPVVTTEYVVMGQDSNGCAAFDTLQVTVEETIAIGVPEAFTPDNDGINDDLYVLGNGIKQMSFVIYNRYGQKVFESNSQQRGWDGTHKGVPLNPGVFVYYLKVILVDNKEQELKGNITLMR